jgi:ubiquinone/menaquinone biosynthesis C-methylase UbiE
MKPEFIFKAMADGTRQRTLAVLAAHDFSVSELVEILRQPQSTVSRHLKVLRDAGLIRDQRDGNNVLYSIQTPAAGANGNGLTGRILEWVSEQELDNALRRRMDAAIGRRRDMSDQFFERIGTHWDTVREESFGRRFHIEAFLSLLPQDWVVADIGTGTGYLLETLAAHFSHVIGVDPVDTMLRVARQRIDEAGRGDRVELRRGDLSRLPLRDSSVDLAVAVLVLHHVPSPSAAVAEIHRIVRNGGRVLFVEQTAHENESFRERMQDRWWGFEPDDLCDKLRMAGFADVRPTMLTTVEPVEETVALYAVTGAKSVAE